MAERDWLYDMMEGLRRDQRDQHAQLRIDMNKGFDQIWEEMKLQNGRVGTSEKKILVIETERNEEDKQAMKRGALTALVASAGLTGLIEGLKALFHR